MLLATVLIAALLVGCGSQDTGSTTTDEDSNETVATGSFKMGLI